MATEESTTELRQRQKQWVDNLHGDKPVEVNNVFWKLISKDSNLQSQTVDKYLEQWDGKTDHDTENRRLDSYNENTFSYYNLVTDFYEYGWGQSFHFCKFFTGDKFTDAIKRHEHVLAHRAGIQQGDLVLDVGCGVGGPAREITKFTNCNLIGINNNDYQIKRANMYTKKEGLDKQCHFVKGDFMNLEFPENTFDKVYAIEATVHAPNLKECYSQIYKVLKPGGVFAVYEWVMTEKYDVNNEEHRKIAYNIEIGDGIPKMFTKDVAVKALEDSGFEIVEQEDLANLDDPVPWYYPLTGDWKYIQNLNDYMTFFRTSYFGRKLTNTMIYGLETLKIIPKGSTRVTDALENAAIGLVAGGKQGLFTPMMLFVAKKPLQED